MTTRSCSRFWFRKAPIGILFVTLLALGYWYFTTESLLKSAHDSVKEYRFADAIAQLQSYISRGGRSSEAFLLLGQTHRRLGDFEAAEQAFLEYQKRLGNVVDDQLDLERILLRAQLGDPDSMMPYLRSLVEREHPRSALIFEAMARGYLRLYRYGDALLMVDLWLKRSPDDFYALLCHGWIRERIGPYSEALDDYRKILALRPDQEEARLRLVAILLDKNRADQAWEYLQPMVQQGKSNQSATVEYYRARCRFAQGYRDEAEKILETLLERIPDHVSAMIWRAKIALDREDGQTAERWLKTAMELQPGNYEIYFDRVRALRLLNRIDEANSLEPKLSEMARSATRLNEILTQHLGKNPQSADLHAEVGELLLKSGQIPEAVHWLNLALKLDPRHATGLRLMKTVTQEPGGTKR